MLSTLNKMLDEYNSLDTNSKSFGDMSRRVLKRFKWDPEDVKYLRSRIVSNIDLLNAFNMNLIGYLFARLG